MKSVNCLTRSLWHWSKYRGTIVYDGNHAEVIGGDRYYHDDTYTDLCLDIKSYGIGYFLNAHYEYLNEEEIEILKRYFEACNP